VCFVHSNVLDIRAPVLASNIGLKLRLYGITSPARRRFRCERSLNQQLHDGKHWNLDAIKCGTEQLDSVNDQIAYEIAQ